MGSDQATVTSPTCQLCYIDAFTNAPWNDVPSFTVVVERLMALKDCEWLSELDFHSKKVELLRKVANVEDYVTKVQLYLALPQIGLISQGDFEVKKQEFVDEIFAPGNGSTEEFQTKVKKLMDLDQNRTPSLPHRTTVPQQP